MVRLPLTPAEVERGRRLGAMLRGARGERSMLETALAARVSPETLRKIETGRIATPAFPTIAAIADVLGLSLDDVWSEITRSEITRSEITRPEMTRPEMTRPERDAEPAGAVAAQEQLAS